MKRLIAKSHFTSYRTIMKKKSIYFLKLYEVYERMYKQVFDGRAKIRYDKA